jgi:hypothetical protein
MMLGKLIESKADWMDIKLTFKRGFAKSIFAKEFNSGGSLYENANVLKANPLQ